MPPDCLGGFSLHPAQAVYTATSDGRPFHSKPLPGDFERNGELRQERNCRGFQFSPSTSTERDCVALPTLVPHIALLPQSALLPHIAFWVPTKTLVPHIALLPQRASVPPSVELFWTK